MTDNEKKFAQGLMYLFQTVKMQQVAIANLMVHDAAIRDALQASPSVQIALREAMEKHSTDSSAQVLAATLQVIDATIASLQQTFGPWKN